MITRKAICPVCDKVFTSTRQIQSCCCVEHHEQWVKLRQSRWHGRNRVKPDDLDWANAKIEELLAGTGKADVLSQFEDYARRTEYDIEELRGQAKRAEEQAAALVRERDAARQEARDKGAELDAAKTRVGQLEKEILPEVRRLSDELAREKTRRQAVEQDLARTQVALTDALVHKDRLERELSDFQVEMEAAKFAPDVAEQVIAELREQAGLPQGAPQKDEAREKEEAARENGPKPAKGKYRCVCSNCGAYFRGREKDEKFCCEQCFDEYSRGRAAL